MSIFQKAKPFELFNTLIIGKPEYFRGTKKLLVISQFKDYYEGSKDLYLSQVK